jgi:hypothetical protein
MKHPSDDSLNCARSLDNAEPALRSGPIARILDEGPGRPGQCGSHTIAIKAAGGGDVDVDAFVVEENGS